MRFPSEPPPEDAALSRWMSEYQAGSAEAFDRLHDALAHDLRAYLRRVSRDDSRADDLLQETFLQMHRARASHIPGLPVRPWAFAIARRVCLMYFRSAGRRARSEDLATVEGGALVAAPIGAERLEARQQVQAALQHAPKRGRLAFVLHHLFGLTFTEVGERLGVTPAAAKMSSSRAARVMKAWLNRSRDA
jgi:RNA polymerase sigma-70 factor, ECF subfamily